MGESVAKGSETLSLKAIITPAVLLTGLAMLAVSFVYDFSQIDLHRFSYRVRYYSYYRYWPSWYGAIFWIAAIYMLVSYLFERAGVPRRLASLYDSPTTQGAIRRFYESGINRLFTTVLLKTKTGKRILRRWNGFCKWLFNPENYVSHMRILAAFLGACVFFHYSAAASYYRKITYSYMYDIAYGRIYYPFFQHPVGMFFEHGIVTWRLFVVPAVVIFTVSALLLLNNDLKKTRKRDGQ